MNILTFIEDLTRTAPADPISDIEQRVRDSTQEIIGIAQLMGEQTDHFTDVLKRYIQANGLEREVLIRLSLTVLPIITSRVVCYKVSGIYIINPYSSNIHMHPIRKLAGEYEKVMSEMNSLAGEALIMQHRAYDDLVASMTEVVHVSGNTDAAIVYVEYPDKPMLYRTEINFATGRKGSEIPSLVPGVHPIQPNLLGAMAAEGDDKDASVYVIWDRSTELKGRLARDHLIGMLINRRRLEHTGAEPN